MRFVTEFRDPALAAGLIREIGTLAARLERGRENPIAVMEVCGGHTHAIFRYGLEGLLPDIIEFVHGPGCPVCVLPMRRVDDCVAIAERPEVIFTTFGDAMRVPGSRKTLLQAKADGADVRMVYSPLDALVLARRHNPTGRSSFSASALRRRCPPPRSPCSRAAREGIANFSVFCNHITIVPTLKAILDAAPFRPRRLLGPGHVSMVIGIAPYRFIAKHYRRPLVVAGFEPIDVLQSLLMVLQQLAEGRAAIENQYARVVPEHGNTPASRAVAEVYETRDFFEWRGLGSIDHSGMRLRALTRLRRRAPLRGARRRIADPAAVPVRRSAEGRHQALGSARCSAAAARRRPRSAR